MTARYARSYVHFDTLSELGHLITSLGTTRKKAEILVKIRTFLGVQHEVRV